MSKIIQLGNGNTLETLEDGTKIQKTSDGKTLTIKPDGTKIQEDKLGNILQVNRDGYRIQTQADGMILESFPDGHTKQTNPDGSKIEVFADKSRIDILADGTIIKTDTEGQQIQEFPNGQKLRVDADGTTTVISFPKKSGENDGDGEADKPAETDKGTKPGESSAGTNEKPASATSLLKLNEIIVDYEERIKFLEKEKIALNSHIDDLILKGGGQAAKLADANERAASMEKNLDKVRDELKDTKVELTEAYKQISELHEDLKLENTKTAELQRENAEKDRRINELEASLHDVMSLGDSIQGIQPMKPASLA